MDDELRILQGGLLALARERPQLSARLENVMSGCRRAALALPRSRCCVLHRDFYPDQLLWDGDRLYLLDLDLLALGDRHVDAGNFVAHIVEWSWRRFGRPDALQACEDAFTRRFLETAPESAADSIRICATLALARHVYLSTRFPDRQHLTEPLLELTELRLNEAGAAVSLGRA